MPQLRLPGARGDQCDNCGHTLDPADLIDPRCKFCGTRPKSGRPSISSSASAPSREALRDWLSPKVPTGAIVVNDSLGFVREGLRDGAITRDMSLGRAGSLPGWESKRIYVWFEACIGYLSASDRVGRTRRATQTPGVSSGEDEPAATYYFIGKDNITFHTILWPAMLMGTGDT